MIDIINDSLVTEGVISFQSRGKSILRNHLYTVYVCLEDDHYIALKKDVIRRMESKQDEEISEEYLEGCHDYNSDVDEEQIRDMKNCSNCGYRRWTANSFLCLKGHI